MIIVEIQLLLPWSEARRRANDVWNTLGYREQILPDGCRIRYYSNGNKYWYNQNDQRHRLDGPAVEYSNGDKDWYQNDKRHCLDGPAIEYSNGYKEWCIKGEYYSEDDFNARLKRLPPASSSRSPNTSNT